MDDDACEIRLIGGLVAIVSRQDFAEISQQTWMAVTVGTEKCPKIYAILRGNGGKHIHMHRAIMGAGPGQRVRHLNGNPLDNRRGNLSCKTTIKRPPEVLKARKEYRDKVRKGLIIPGLGRHVLSAINGVNSTAVCSTCGPVSLLRRSSRGKYYFCCAIARAESRGKQRGFGEDRSYMSGKDRAHYQRHKGPCCERCGFIPSHSIQLDVHHRDLNHRNNAVSNLETVCANCHRLDHKIRGLTMPERAAQS